LAIAGVFIFGDAINYKRAGVGETFLIGVPSAACIWLGARVRLAGAAKWLAHVFGDASYSIYLTHLIAVSTVLGLLAKHWHPVPNAVLILLCLAGAAALGIAIHKIAELRIVDVSRKLLLSPRAQPAPAQVSPREGDLASPAALEAGQE
jgi:peptidoglycan/LPS O-acetylase OafA/YrhL